MTRSSSLRLAHVKTLSSLDALDVFDQLKEIHELSRETVDMHAALRIRTRTIMEKLRRDGVTEPEICRRSGLTAKQVQIILNREFRTKDATVLE